ALTQAMLGGAPPETVGAAKETDVSARMITPPRVVLALEHATWRDARGVLRVRDASLRVHAGEIVGIAAGEGAGQHEVWRLVAGRLTLQHGTLTRPHEVGFVPEDRHRDAVMLDAPLYENVALRGAGSRRGRMLWPAWRAQ